MADNQVIPQVNDSSSNNNNSGKVLIVKLCRDNWTEWKKIFTNVLIGCGHKEVFNVQWCLLNKDKRIFRKKSVLAWTILHASISADLKPIAAASENFSKAMISLAAACGKNSLIKLGNKLYSLISLVYVPGTSIGSHISTFTSLYTSLKSAIATTKSMTVDTTMAGFFFPQKFLEQWNVGPVNSKSVWRHTILVWETCRLHARRR